MKSVGWKCQRSLLVLGGSWVVTSRVISRITVVLTHIRGLIAPFITTHEPPSMFVRTSSPRSHFGIFRAAKGLCCPPRTKLVKSETCHEVLDSTILSLVYHRFISCSSCSSFVPFGSQVSMVG